MHVRTLLVLPALFAVAPLSAHQGGAPDPACPYEAALTGAESAGRPVVVIDRAPERSAFGTGSPSEILP
ncbi:MAG TPA: hypothetical protein VJM15_01215 [Sphingomicrobium sp.]|nr:hypothetical protein [Sphingomicrobium sp.]